MAPAMNFELVQFEYSTFNEKARWALDYKAIRHTRRTLLPGPHMRTVKKMAGRTSTPVLIIDGEPLQGSAAIIDRLETLFPEKPLYPAPEKDKEKALEIQRRFDKDWGPRTRRAILGRVGQAKGYTATMFAKNSPALSRFLYRSALPFAAGLIRKGNGITGPESIADGDVAFQEAFDFVVKESSATGFLAGDSFSVADLTACSFLASAVNPPNCDMARPEPVPEPVAGYTTQWRAHPGAEWVLKMYREWRPNQVI